MTDANTLAETTISDVLKALGVEFSGVKHETVAGQEVLSIETPESARLIGTHGDTVHALDHLVKKIVETKQAREAGEGATAPREPLFLVDVNGYRTQKIKELESKALVMAERARSFQYDVELSPMSSYERLIVHNALSDAPNVKTESQGEGPNRRVVIRYVA